MTQEPSKKQKFLEKFSYNLQKNRIILLALLGIIIVVVVGLAIWSDVKTKRLESSTQQIEAIQEKYELWASESDDAKKAEKEKELTSALEDVLTKYPKLYAGQRALFIRGQMAFEKKEWDSAASFYLELKKIFPKSYLASISLVNAAVAYEEKGDTDKAIEMYKLFVESYKEENPDTARIFFSLGRLYEEKNDKENALKYYNDLSENYPDSDWTKFAKSRIIYLETR
jgi:TolA-binding protein